VDEKGDNFTRYRGSNGFIYKNGILDYCEAYYNFGNFYEQKRDQDFDDKFGSFDLETMVNEDVLPNIDNFNIVIKDSDLLGLGEQSVYAGGWKTKDFSDYKYADKIVNKDNIIVSLIDSIFEHELYNYTFFVHNLGKFDALYLIKAINKNDDKYSVKGKWKTADNKLLGLTVIDKKSRKRIYFKDSLNFFNKDLKNVLKDYGCQTQKGCFPHTFMNSSKLNYIGYKPHFKYYDGKISRNEYKQIPFNN
jgi:hypothetical protein